MAKITATVAGNVGGLKEVRELGEKGTDTENYVLNFSIAATESRFDRKKKEWVDDPTNFVKVTVWGKKALYTSRSIKTGDPVVAVGVMKMKDEWENDAGETVAAQQYLDAQIVAVEASTGRGTVDFVKNGGSGGSSSDSEGKPAAAPKKSTKKAAPKKESKPKDDDEFDLDLDLDIDDDEDPGF